MTPARQRDIYNVLGREMGGNGTILARSRGRNNICWVDNIEETNIVVSPDLVWTVGLNFIKKKSHVTFNRVTYPGDFFDSLLIDCVLCCPRVTNASKSKFSSKSVVKNTR